MKKWIRDYESEQKITAKVKNTQVPMKIGLLVRSTLKELVSSNSITEEQIRLLQDDNYCKNTFDINYPFLKKVLLGTLHSLQRKINGHDRYWEKSIMIKGEKYFVCNDWYERNRTKFIAWSNQLIH